MSGGLGDAVMRTSLACRVEASPNHEPRASGRAPDMLLLHYTGTATGQSALTWLCHPKSKVSSHYFIDEDGAIVQLVDEAARAWHAGQAHWAGEDDINSCSIGIEIQNPGHDHRLPDFPEIQMRAVVDLCADIVSRHAIAPERVLGHSDVSPLRKIDPGEKFDWRRLHDAGIGHWVAPAALADGPQVQLGDQGDEVRDIQQALKTYGYGLEASGLYDAATRQVVAAFQRHFRPSRIDGVFDLSTRDTLERLSAALPLAS